MKLPKYGGREYRVLAIAVAFFLVGILFFLWDTARPSSSGNSAGQTSPSAPARSIPSNDALNPEFANFPSPSQFRTFTYNGTELNGHASLTVSATCHDTYVAVLVFPAAVDYRANVTRAVYNAAFPCTIGQAFSAVIDPSDLGNAPSGTYYFFAADQGTSGTWYNPK